MSYVVGFNPTRVRLKPVIARPSALPSRMLQPHKGSSETFSIATATRPARPLQPHKGSSETGYKPRSMMYRFGLQPHKGSSETVATSLWWL